MTIGERIKLVRDRKGMSRKEFAEFVGGTEGEIINLEFDRLKKPELKGPLISCICEKCKIRKEWLEKGEGEMEEELTHEQQIVDFATKTIKCEDESIKKRLVVALSQLSDNQWDELQEFLDKLFLDKLKEGRD